jgi:hypothetical protein
LTDELNPSKAPAHANPAQPDIDPDLQAIAREVFDVARRGDAAMLAAVIRKGVPPNLRNEKATVC